MFDYNQEKKSTITSSDRTTGKPWNKTIMARVEFINIPKQYLGRDKENILIYFHPSHVDEML